MPCLPLLETRLETKHGHRCSELSALRKNEAERALIVLLKTWLTFQASIRSLLPSASGPSTCSQDWGIRFFFRRMRLQGRHSCPSHPSSVNLSLSQALLQIMTLRGLSLLALHHIAKWTDLIRVWNPQWRKPQVTCRHPVLDYSKLNKHATWMKRNRKAPCKSTNTQTKWTVRWGPAIWIGWPARTAVATDPVLTCLEPKISSSRSLPSRKVSCNLMRFRTLSSENMTTRLRIDANGSKLILASWSIKIN